MWRSAAPARKSYTPTSPNTAPATQNECHQRSASHMKHHFQCAEQQEPPSNFTKYCACHAKSMSSMIRITYETSFPMRGATRATPQLHQILRLPRKNESHQWSASRMKRHFQCTEQVKSPTKLTKHCACHEILRSRFQRGNPEFLPPIERRFEHTPNTIRPDDKIIISHPPLRRPFRSDLGDDFVLTKTTFRAPAISQNVTKCCACQEKLHSNVTKYCACHTKWMSSMIRITYETSFPMRGATRATLQLHQILAPATQNQCHQWSASHMKHHFQCAEQQEPPSNFTKYCACHAKWISSMICITYETSCPMHRASKVTLETHQVLRLPRNSEVKISTRKPWIPSANRKTIRTHSEHNPTIKSSSRARRFGDLPGPILATILYWKIQHFALRLSPKMWRSAAPATKSHTPTSPNTAPATRNLTELLVDWAVTLLSCYLTELLIDWIVTYWAVTLLSCYLTELLLDWTVTLLNCDFWTITLLNFLHFKSS